VLAAGVGMHFDTAAYRFLVYSCISFPQYRYKYELFCRICVQQISASASARATTPTRSTRVATSSATTSDERSRCAVRTAPSGTEASTTITDRWRSTAVPSDYATKRIGFL